MSSVVDEKIVLIRRTHICTCRKLGVEVTYIHIVQRLCRSNIQIMITLSIIIIIITKVQTFIYGNESCHLSLASKKHSSMQRILHSVCCVWIQSNTLLLSFKG